MSQSKSEIAFIGLGAMGFGMATNLVKQGYPVTGFDVYGPTLERFKQAGGDTASTPADAVAGKEYCVCMVATAQQAQDVLLDGEQSALSALRENACILLCSTVPCAYVQGLQAGLLAKGRPDILLVDCPVSGGAIRAADGTLSIMAGASDAAIEKGREILQAMSDPKKLYIVRGGIGAGSNMKMCHQVLAANQILSASEGMGFASRLGLGMADASKSIVGSDGWSWMLENRLPRILHPEHQPLASALFIILKDTSIITAEARRLGFATPMTSAAEQVYFAGVGRGYGPDDDGSLIRLYTEGRGIASAAPAAELPTESKISLVVGLLKGIHVCAATEALVFARHVGLDLDQVYDLCTNAAGGSRMLSSLGPELIKSLQGSSAEKSAGPDELLDVFADLRAAADEAQRLKMPMFLGNSALNLIQMAQNKAASDGSGLSKTTLAAMWER